ncbi:ketosteroid isomerase, partial [Bradyrhizobium sp. SUTN9-2]
MATKIAVIELPNVEQVMASLPTANAEITQFFREWLDTFAGYVREV